MSAGGVGLQLCRHRGGICMLLRRVSRVGRRFHLSWGSHRFLVRVELHRRMP